RPDPVPGLDGDQRWRDHGAVEPRRLELPAGVTGAGFVATTDGPSRDPRRRWARCLTVRASCDPAIRAGIALHRSRPRRGSYRGVRREPVLHMVLSVIIAHTLR